MARFERRYWVSEYSGIGLPKKDVRSGPYEVYRPDFLAERRFAFRDDTHAVIAEAQTAILRLNERADSLANTEALARLLLRADSIASSRIEGLEVGARRLLRADAARLSGATSSDVTANEVLANVDAMSYATSAIGPTSPISLEHILETHRRLLIGSRHLAQYAGKLRERQNWIGGSPYNPCAATFVPPPPETVAPLMNDLVRFCNDESLPAVAQAAMAHAQFETIHPFVDGNGRVGRALIQMVLRQRGLAENVLPPVSLVLATWGNHYVEALRNTSYVGSPDGPYARTAIGGWVDLFSRACIRAVSDADAFEKRVGRVRASWVERIGRVRGGSALSELIRVLPGTPLLTVQGASELIGRSFDKTNEAVAKLVDVGVLRQTTFGRRNRAFEAPDVIDAFTALERQLASPVGDTSIERPSRLIPYRHE